MLDNNNKQKFIKTHSTFNEQLELFSLDSEKKFSSLDDCINTAYGEELFSIKDYIQGQRKPKKKKYLDKKPIVFVRFNTKHSGRPRPVTLRALLDSGASGCLVESKYAKKLKLKGLSKADTVWTTPGGSMQTSYTTTGQFTIPELHDNRLLEWKLHVTKNLGAYDMILGRDFMSDLGIDIKFSDMTVEWDGHSIPLKNSDATVEESYYIPDSGATDDATERLKKILDAKYEKANLREIADASTHLTVEEREELYELLQKYESLFDGELGVWKDEEYNIELKPDVQPYHARAFPVPHIHMATLKTEVERLCKAGVLKKVNRSEWAAPTFVIPKKDGTVRFISDFRELNKRIRRKPYPIPKIQDMLLKLQGFRFATSLDLNMGYYHIELNPDSKRLCTIVLPFGKFEYQRLPMGLCNSPDIFQEKMSELFAGLDFVRAYIDDLLITSNSTWQDHLEKLDLVFFKLREAGLKVNAKKSFFGKHELEYLGYWITRTGISPVAKKVEAIQQIATPKNKKDVRAFIGIVNYYRDMWPQRSHILAPLAKISGKTAKWEWGPEQQEAFEKMKKEITSDVLLAYPDFEKPFVIHTDASHTQLGAVISQDGRPIAFYSRKLKPEQTRYTTTERELLSIVETLKEFRNILLGHKIVVWTDHKNLTCKNFNTERVMRWRLVLEEYGPELRYIKGESNTVADSLSRLPIDKKLAVKEQAEVYSLFEVEEPKNFPFSYGKLESMQQRDAYIQKRLKEKDSKYSVKAFKRSDYTYNLVMYDDGSNGRIALPKALGKAVATWYHDILCHPGEVRTELSISQHFYWKGMRNTIASVCKKCATCLHNKPKNVKYGKIPAKMAPEHIPWHTLCIDLIGPYRIGPPKMVKKKGSATKVDESPTLWCLTMIDPATGWFEIAQIKTKRADIVANVLEQYWFNRYPWPTEVVLDRGSEFMAEVKDMIRDDYGVIRKAITTRNPQANSIVERAHKTLDYLIKSQVIHKQDQDEVEHMLPGILSAVAFGMRATVHTTNRATPAQLVFGRDAIHNVNFIADWQYIKERKQSLIVQNNNRENKRRREHTYSPGDKVLIKQDLSRKHGDSMYKGPYTISRVYDNGTVDLQQQTQRGGVLTQRWNIRNLHPCRD